MAHILKEISTPPAPSLLARGWWTPLARWGWLAAFLLGGALYLPTLRYGFTYDDNIIIEFNPRIRQLGEPARYLGTSWWDRPQGNREYRPLTMATFALNYAMHETRPAGFHAVNIALHGMNAALVFWLVLGLFGLPAAASVAGLIFALHPVHMEAVAGVVGRAELLMTFGFLTALLAAHASRRASTVAGRAGWAVATFAMTGLSVFSKEHGVMLLPVTALLILIPRHAAEAVASPSEPSRRPLRAQAAWLWPALLASALAIALYFLTRFLVLGAFLIPENAAVYRIDNPLVSWSGTPRFLGVMSMFGRYGMLLVAPFNPSPDYSLGVIDPLLHPNDPYGWLGLALVALAGWGLWRLRARPAARFGLWFMLVTFAITSNVFLTIGTIMGERLLYLPSAGFCIMLGGLTMGERAAPRRLGHWGWGLLMVWTAALLFQHFRYLPRWRDSDSLLGYMAIRVPDSVRAKAYRALVLGRAGKPREALQAALDALNQAPEFTDALAAAGTFYAELGENDKALEVLEREQMICPNNHHANRLLSELLTRKGLLGRAESVLREGVRTDPKSSYPRYLLGAWLHDRGRWREAVPLLKRAARRLPQPERGNAQRMLARCLLELGQPTESVAVLVPLVEADPEDTTLFPIYIRALRAMGQPAQAEQRLQEALARWPDDPELVGLSEPNRDASQPLQPVPRPEETTHAP